MTDTQIRKNRPLVRTWLIGALVLALGLMALVLTPVPHRNLPVLPDSRFVMTTLARMGLPPNAALKDRAFVWLFGFLQKFRQRHPQPLAHSFPATPTNRCSVHGLLNQCMEVSGVCYIIPRVVAAGTVQFGHTNVLNGVQWVAAFTEALQNGQPEWWDPKIKGFRKENLIFLTNGPRAVLVLPPEMVHEFQRQGQ
jgi:hypothetical protein